VDKVSHRHYSTGFYYGYPGQYTDSARYIRDWQVLAVVTDCDEAGNATLSLRNKFAAGDEVELMGPDTPAVSFTAPMMADGEGQSLAEPRHPQMVFRMKLPCPVKPLSILRACRENS
jgi:putative protease